MKKNAFVLLLGLITYNQAIFAQNDENFSFEEISLEDMSAFQSTAPNWGIAGKVQADLNKKQKVSLDPGTGILFNNPDDTNKAQLFTKLEHGDLDLAFDFMMPKGSNSGVYLQGRYEIQLLDSWGKKRPSFGDLGGIYQRWDNEQPKGQEGFEGTAPSMNVAKAPGLWQHMQISFQAPRFDHQGNKISNARIISIVLNGVTIHRNVELTGPTRGNYVAGEGATGPIVIQGDHGPVAFRNIKYRSFLGKPLSVSKLNYQAVRQPRNAFKDWETVKLDAIGSEELITWEVAKTENNFSIRYTGVIEVPKSGKFLFRFTSGGAGWLTLDGKELFANQWGTRTKFLTLSKGQHSFEIEYSKSEPWLQGRLGLEVAGEDFRPTALNYTSSNITGSPVDPIFVNTGANTKHLRSFIDFKSPSMDKAKRITHAINIGDPTQTHYTYDLGQGTLVQAWKGGFLNVTPMWHNRGNGVSIPMGAVLQLTSSPQVLLDGAEKTKGLESYQYKSYQVDEDNRPTFHFYIHGLDITDQILPREDRKGLLRKVKFSGQPNESIIYCLATSDAIEKVDKNTFIVGDGQFYIQSDSGLKIRSLSNQQQMLFFSVNGPSDLDYQIIW